jgi:urease accessory protein
MGADPNRIAGQEFVTPPEFRSLRLADNEAGRVGGARLELVQRDGQTYLAQCYQQIPLRVAPLFHLPGEEAALLYLQNPTAGLLDGDGQLVQLTVRAGCRALVVGQSATRLHPCLAGFATQQWHINVETGAVLVVLPGPTMPFKDCRYYQHVEVELADGATFLWGDIGLPGRYARGNESERFQFTSLIQQLAVRRSGQLVFRDRFCWQGPWTGEQQAWHVAEGTAWGSLFATGTITEGAQPPSGLSVTRARFTTAHADSCFRCIGPAEEVTNDVVQAALAVASAGSGVAASRAWFSEGSLAPTHWFRAVETKRLVRAADGR